MAEIEALEAEIARDRSLRYSIKAGEISSSNDSARIADFDRRIALNETQVAILTLP